MLIIKIDCCEFEEAWPGYIRDYPDYWTWGSTLVELQNSLRNLYTGLATRDQSRNQRATETTITTAEEITFDVDIRGADLRWALVGRHLLN